MQKELSEKESLQIITRMISEAKRNVARGGSFYFLLWGFVVAIANLGHYILWKFTDFPNPYIVWLLVVPAVIITIVYSYRQGHNTRVKGPLDRIYGHIWIAVFVCIMVILVFMSRINFNVNPIILLVSGIGTYVTGILLRFNPLIIGGISLWVVAIISFFLAVMDQYLAASIGIIIGYIIPGILLKRAEK